MTCSIKLGASVNGVRNSEVEVRVDLTPIAGSSRPLDSGTLRFTIAVVTPNGRPFTSTRRLDHAGLSSAGRLYTIGVRHRDDAKMAVIAADSPTGSWGGCAVKSEE